ncbi:hypothetical protein ACH5RR_030490 [Cinchona calisaya]|uniref:Transmembrane protein n=1 Tax=Cinchona calisaya TaxID=153742 RepID=A0ABD2YXQ6_9GENT
MENEDISAEQSDWVIIQSLSTTNNENTVAVIKDSSSIFNSTDCAIFPPSNHQDLPVVSPNKDPLIEGQEQLFHPSSSSDGEVEKKAAGSWIRSRLGFLSSWIDKIVSRRRSNRAVFRTSIIWLFASAATGVGAMVLVVVLCKIIIRRAKRWQRLVQPENKQHLILLIKDKDQKINQLVLQLAQLNGLLSARRRVPVLQVA